MATEPTLSTVMSPEQLTIEVERLRALMTNAEDRESERQRKLRPIVGAIRIVMLFLVLSGVILMLAEQIYGFKGYIGAVASQFMLLGALLALVWHAFQPLMARP